jgi:fluoride exporter
VEPIDPDLDPDEELVADEHSSRAASGPGLDVLLVIAVGGGLGGLARYAVQAALPTASWGFPWATFAVNVSGCLLLGMLMVFATEGRTPHRYVRPFLGVGVLGGYTTFSTYTAQSRALLAGGHAVTGLTYLVVSVLVGLLACAVGLGMARSLLR